MKKRLLFVTLVFSLITQAQTNSNQRGSKTMTVTYLGTSPKLTEIKPISSFPEKARLEDGVYVVPNKLSKSGVIDRIENPISDPVIQNSNAPLFNGAAVKVGFDGGSNQDNAIVNGIQVAPPDTQGDVGPNHYIQMTNSVTTIFDKSGNTVFGPSPNSVFFQNLDPRLAGTNDGDPVVVYDQFEDRWIVSQFAISAGAPYFMLVAVSQTGDPLGAYNQYAIDYGNDFPDYPKLGVWNDALFITTRDFENGSSFAGFSIVAIDKFDMYSGIETNAQRFEIDNPDFDGILPADADGNIPPPAGEPHYSLYLSASGNLLNLVTTAIDFDTPENSTLIFSTIPVAAYSFFQSQVSQPNGQTLDALPFFLMYRLQYMNFGTHASMLTNHTVQQESGGTFGIRWYEFRKTATPWSVYQQGTYLPDDNLNRWMGSIAMNGEGDIALGYSVAGSTLNPSIRFVGQTSDQSGTGSLNVAETSILEGTLSSRGTNRWGDYAMMSVDPVDGDFWFTQEYVKNDSSFSGWGTYVSEFAFGNPPIALCQDIAISLDETGIATITPDQIDNGSIDFNGGTVTLSLDVDTFDCSNLGENMVNLIVTGSEGIPASCSARVVVLDNIAPIAVCQDIAIRAKSTGSTEITFEQVDGGSSDNCGINNATFSKSTFTIADIGENIIDVVVSDSSGNTAVCQSTITVIDEAEIGPPIAVCQDLVVQLNTSGVATITPEQIDNGSSDAIGAPAELSLDITNFDCSNLGVNTVILTVTDASNLTTTCTANVTVEDVLLPTVECRNITVTLDSDGQATITPEDLINSGNGQILGLYPWGGSGQNTLYTFDYDVNTNDIAVKENPFGTLVGNNLSIAQNPVDNKIYVLFDAGAGQGQNFDRALYLFDIESRTIGDKIASIVSVTGQNTPNIMDFDNDGNLYFGFKNGEINKFDLSTSTMSAFAQVPLNRAVGITFDDDENRLIFASQSASRTSTSFFEIDLQGSVNLLFELISPCGSTGQAMDYVGGGKIVASGTFGCNRMFAIDLNTQSIETILSPLGISAGGNLKDILFLPEGASDNCEISNFSLSQSSFTIDDIGENTVEIIVTDSSGNSASCEATVTVRESTPFVTTWNTAIPDESDDRTIVIPTFEGENYNYSVNWGDGQIDSGLTGDATHTYDVSGTYQVSISGDFPRIYFAGIGDNSKIIAVEQWGEIEWTSMEDAFNGCNNLDVVAIDLPDLSQVTNLNRMFAGCNSLIGNTTFNDWDVSTITSMNAFFSQANSFNQDLDKWNVSNVEEMSGMFFVNNGFNGNIGTWDVSNVRAMNQMFQNATAFNQDLNNWNTGSVTDMQLMFSGASLFNGNITNWNTSNVSATFEMFKNATAFNQDIGSWDISNVEIMFSMFESATSFDQDLSAWDISSVGQQTPETGMASMFLNAGLSEANYDNTLIGWATLSDSESQIPLDVVFDGGNSQFCLAELARQNLIDSFGWSITDGGIAEDCERPFITTWKTDNEGFSGDNQIKIPYSEGGNYTINWGDGTFNTNVTTDITHTYASSGTYQISISGNFTSIPFGNIFLREDKDNQKLLSVDQWGSAIWTDLTFAFYGCTNLRILAADAPDLTGISSLNNMFAGATSMNDDLSNWDFSSITDMSDMFRSASNFNQDVSTWGIENVENFSNFLNRATSFDKDLGNLSIARVLNLEQFLAFSGITPENYDKTLIGWNNQTEKNSNVYLSAERVHYCEGEDARNQLIDNFDWFIFDAGRACPMTIPFVSTWKTDNPGSSEDNQIRIGYNYIGNYNIDWGDGTNDQNVISFITHTYDTPGTYQITITGTYPEITFGDSFDAEKLISIDQWGDSQWISMEKAFFNCENFQILATDIPDLSQVKNMDRMFANADSMNSNLSNWDFSAVEDMQQMFAFNSVFNQDISTWNVSSVNNMARMFFEAEQFNQNLGNWNVSNVTNMFEIFRESGLSDENYDKILNGWSTLENLQLNVVLGAQSNNYCEGAEARQQLINDFNWVIEDRGENCPVGECDVLVNLALNKTASQSSTYADGIAGIAVDGNTFGDSPWTADATLQHTISGEFQPWWQVDLGEVATINSINIFNRTDKLQSRLNNFYILFSDTPFSSSSSLDDLLSNTGATVQFFEGEAGLEESLEFEGSGRYVRIQLSGNGTIHMAEVEVLGCSSQDLTRPFVTTWKTDNPGTSEDNQITIPTFDGETYDYAVDWGDGTTSENVTGDITHTYVTPGTYTVSISGDFPRIYFNYYGDSNKVLSVDSWGSIKWSSMEDAFSGAFNLDVIAEDIPDLSQVTTTRNMFANCRNLKGTISFDNWDVSNVENMDSMFVWALLFNQQLSEWDVSNVLNMNYMFGFNLEFNGDISNWNTSNVEIMAGMFDTANSFNQDIGNWNVSNVKDMSYMFLSMEIFNQDISGWDVSNVTNMTETFQSSPLFDQDLSSWRVSNVTDMSRIFRDSGLSNENYDQTLIGWSQLPSLQSGVQLDAPSNQYCLSEEARQSIIDNYGWTINDGGKAADCADKECTTFTNIALNKTAIQSSTYGDGLASIAVDGNTLGDSPWTADATLQHTVSGEFQSWWQVDLGESSAIKGINVFNRTDKLQSRLNNFYILISETPFSETATLSELLADDAILNYFFEGEAGLEENFDFDTNGRYVRIQLSGTGTLHMAEVEVLGCQSNVDPCSEEPITIVDAAGPFTNIDGIQTLIANPAGGTWGGASTDGTFEPSVLGPGTYTVTYTTDNGSGCVQIVEIDIVVTDVCDGVVQPLIDAIGPFTTNDGVQTLAAFPAGGVWSGASTDGTFDTSIGEGIYTVNYTIDNGAGCIQTTSIDIIVNEDSDTGDCTSPINIALNKMATQSSTYGDGVASIAVDGNTFGDSPWTADATLQHTVSGEFQPWWQVDLGESSSIKGITIFNRSDKLQARLNNFYILISETPFSETATLSELLADDNILNYFFEGEAGLEENFDFDTNGRYVRVQLTGTGTLHMAEVEVFGCVGQAAPRPFVTTWKTDNPGISDDNQITIPTFPGETYNYTVDWGDGTTTENVTGDVIHSYSASGTYTVSISGDFPRIYFNDAFDVSNNDSDKIITVNSWGNTKWSSMQAAFAGCDNLDVIADDIPDLSTVNSTAAMFLSCGNLVGNSKFNEWNMASVIEMQAMFNRATLFNQALNNWNTSSVVNSNGMFSLASNFNQPLNSWNMANAENIAVMFGDAISFNQPLNEWNTSSVVNMNGVFGGAVAFNYSLESWDVSNVEDMSSMLSGSGLSNENYDVTLIGWSQLSSLQNNVDLGAFEKEYCLSEVARQSIIDTYGWVINDAGKAEDCGTVGCLKPGNVAFNKPTEQSTTYGNGLSLYAVDGNIVGESPWSADLQHTISGESQSWWQVDLEGNFSIENIVIFNRSDKLQSRLNNFYVLISETPFSPTATLDELLTDENIEHIFFEGAAGLEAEIAFETTGRYVRVQLSDVGTLHMAEVQVFGCSLAVPLTANLNEMSLYPNPANDFINVSFEELAEVKAFFVYDISGRIIQRSKPELNQNSYLLNVAQLPTGTYFVKAIAVDGVAYYKRMVIKR